MNATRPSSRGSRVKAYTCCSTSLPGPSSGCALPAKMICTGRHGFTSRSCSRSKSLNSRAARLYVANRRAKPITRASGLIRVPAPTTCAASFHRSAQRRRASSRMKATSPCFMSEWTLHSSRSSMVSTASQKPGSSQPLDPPLAEVPVEQPQHPARHPGGEMHAVGDRADRHLVGLERTARANSRFRGRPRRASSRRR